MHRSYFCFPFVTWLVFFLLVQTIGTAQQLAGHVWEYTPAPGQFVNQSDIGTPEAAQNLVNSTEGIVSLGAFGGTLIVGFEQPIENDPLNPYGIDFIVFGNALPFSSEPATVWVMVDVNGNGQPDDTWYRLAGSEEHFSEFVENYEVTYTNPQAATDVPWHDNFGNSGAIVANSFHGQPYYPQAENFPDIPPTSYTLAGSRISSRITTTNGNIELLPYSFGYADNLPVNSFNPPFLPDNPYTTELEGNGGDAMDISWAVDEAGVHVDLPSIHFVKIQATLLEDAAWLGEVSPEIKGVADVAALATSEPFEDRMIALNFLPHTLFSGESLAVEAVAFKMGKKVDEPLQWSVSDSEILSLDDGEIVGEAEGTATLRVVWQNAPAIYAEHTFQVLKPVSVAIEAIPDVVPGEEVELSASVLSESGAILPDLDLLWETSDPAIASLIFENNRVRLQAIAPGTTTVTVTLERMPTITASLEVTVLETGAAIRISLTVYAPSATLYEREALKVSVHGLGEWIGNPLNGNYGAGQYELPTLAHAISEFFRSNNLEQLQLSDDVRGNDQLYISQIGKTFTNSVQLLNGFGGSTELGFRSGWLLIKGETGHYTGLDQIAIAPNDELIAFYAEDVTQQQRFTHLSLSPSHVEAGEVVHLRYQAVEASAIDSERQTSVSYRPISGESVLVNGTPYLEAGTPLTTDASGNAFLTFQEEGVYRIEVAQRTVTFRVGQEGLITHLNLQNDFSGVRIFPNPFKNKIRIENPTVEEINFQLISFTGKEIKKGTFNQDTYIDMKELPQGIYLLILKKEKSHNTFKLIKK